MPILLAVWACFKCVQRAITCVQTLYYCLKHCVHPAHIILSVRNGLVLNLVHNKFVPVILRDVDVGIV